MARVRLTARKRMAVEDKTPYPGTVNQENRKFKKKDQYHKFTQTVNHELPDKRTEWKDNPRDEIGFGVPKIAKIYASAQQATRLALLFLGDKCDKEIIEAQARDFMRLGSTRIANALKRFQATEKLYAQEEDEEKQEQKVEDTVSPEEETIETETNQEDNDNEKKAEQNEEVNEKDNENNNEETNENVEEEETKESCDNSKKASEEDNEGEEEIVENSDEDIELESPDITPEDEGEAEIEAIFSDEEIDDNDDTIESSVSEEVKKTAKKKEGVKTLGGQPTKVASADADELVSLWKDAPDVSSIF